MGWEPVKSLIPYHLGRFGKNQRWLADKVGESESQVSIYVNMDRIFGMKKAKKYATILKCSIDNLYEWKYLDD